METWLMTQVLMGLGFSPEQAAQDAVAWMMNKEKKGEWGEWAQPLDPSKIKTN